MGLNQEAGWSLGALDVTTAFLHAELVDSEDGIYLITPPAILVALGLVPTGIVWKLNKVLYGLRSGPKRWGLKRDFELAKAEIVTEEGDEATCQPGVACSTCWTVTSNGKTVARFLVYVDDIVISGPVKWVRAVMNMVQTLWPVKVTGIMSTTSEQDTLFVNKMNFLGITIEMTEDGTLEMHQHQYLVTKLRDRNMLAGTGKTTLPMPCEGKLVPEIKDKSFEIRKKGCSERGGNTDVGRT